MTAYYNEFDAKKAAWLRELIDMGMIAPGEVDERSIKDVRPDELMGYTQVHAFAGIGVWSYALRLAGWPDDRPVWTGSAPCQPFSSAGKGKAFDDERHFWPAFAWLIGECRPPVVIGEQVASKAGRAWFDLVSDDLEGMDYAVGALSIPACGIGAPHIRQRLWFVAQSSSAERGQGRAGRAGEAECGAHAESAGPGDAGLVAHPRRRGLCSGDGQHMGAAAGGVQGEAREQRVWADAGDGELANFWTPCDWLPCRDGKWRPTGPGINPLVMADPKGKRRQQERGEERRLHGEDGEEAQQQPPGGCPEGDPGPLVQRLADPVRGGREGQQEVAGSGAKVDGEGRPADEPGDQSDDTGGREGPTQSSPAEMAHGPARGVGRGRDILNTPEARVLRLRGYGDAIVAPLAAEFIRAAMEVIP